MTKPTGEAPKKRGPKPKHDIPPEVWGAMTPAERNAVSGRSWWGRNRDRVNKSRKKRYKTDKQFRRSILKAAKRNRPHELAAKAAERFERMVADKHARAKAQEDQAAREGKPVRAGKRPRFAEIDGAPVWVYPTGVLALRVGRVPSVIRLWLEQDVLPGCSIPFGGKAFFSEAFIAAAYEACRRVYFYDGNGSRAVLKRLFREELAKVGVSWVPHGKTEAERVHPEKPVATAE